MAVFAETLVDEWLNRQKFFTVRGLRQGNHEIDLLGVRPSEGSGLEAWHVEVQASFNPIGYISKWLPHHIKAGLATRPTSAGRRTPDVIRECAQAWVHSKFDSPTKVRMRDGVWARLSWRRVLVHAVTLSQHEVQCIADCGVATVSLRAVMRDLNARVPGGLVGVAGTDVAELVAFLAADEAQDHRRMDGPDE